MGSNTNRRARSLRGVGVAAGGVLAACAIAACGSSSKKSTGTDTGSSSNMAAQIAAALQKPTTLTFWSWTPQSQALVTAFEKKYPKVTVHLVNAGSGTTEYTKLQNVVKSGSGIPDVAQIEYLALPQFVLAHSLTDLNQFGFGSLKSEFSTAVWDGINPYGELAGLPQDSGPMALFYNKAVFDKYGLAVPKTWAEYYADAKKLHAANSKEYITSDTGDPNVVNSLIWAAGGRPLVIKNTKDITVNYNDAGSQEFAKMWGPFISNGLVAPVTAWSDAWYTGLGNGSIASLVIGGWMASDLESGVTAAKGDWRVAPMPQYSSSSYVTSQDGGSSDAVLKASKNQLAAAGFVQFIDVQEGAQISANSGDFPAMNSILTSPSFLAQAPAYFGGQKINAVLGQAAAHVGTGWSYLPFQVYANTIFPDSVSGAYNKKISLQAGITAWGKAIATYGNQEGFSVTTP